MKIEIDFNNAWVIDGNGNGYSEDGEWFFRNLIFGSKQEALEEIEKLQKQNPTKYNNYRPITFDEYLFDLKGFYY